MASKSHFSDKGFRISNIPTLRMCSAINPFSKKIALFFLIIVLILMRDKTIKLSRSLKISTNRVSSTFHLKKNLIFNIRK